MLKLLVTGALVYFAYRFFFQQTAIDQQEARESSEVPKWDRGNGDDEEYVDYEEVD